MSVQMEEDWGDRATLIYNPTFEVLPLVVSKLKKESRTEIVLSPKWADNPFYVRLAKLSSRIVEIGTRVGERSAWETSRHVKEGWFLIVAEIRPKMNG